MLDDLKMIHQRDMQDALGRAAKQPQQLARHLALSQAAEPNYFNNIVFAGTGNAAMAAAITQCWMMSSISKPFQAVQGYELPAYVTNDTLFIAASVNGDDPVTLSFLAQAETRGAQIVVITADGDGNALAAIARDKRYPLVSLPAGIQQFTCWSIVKALLVVLESYGLTGGNKERATVELEAQAQQLADQCKQWGPEVSVKSNIAKQIALELMGKTVVIYTGALFSPAAHYWKASINMHARQLAWCDQYVDDRQYAGAAGWLKQPVHKPYAVIELRSPFERPRVQKIILAANKLLSGLRPSPFIVEPVGDTLLGQLLYATALADFVSIYLALLSGINPSVTDFADKINKEIL